MSSTHTTESGPTRPMTGHQARKGSAMNAFTLTTTYAEACDHAQRNYEATNGLVRGGTYMVRFDDDTVVEVELRVGESGIARPAR